MSNDVDVIAIAFYCAALQEQRRLKRKQDKFVAAAVANLLVGKENPVAHTEEQRKFARALAAKLLKTEKIRFAAVMCLRANMLTVFPQHPTVADYDAGMKFRDVIDWVATIGEIPSVLPNPNIMQQLQHDMAMEYCPHAVESVNKPSEPKTRSVEQQIISRFIIFGAVLGILFSDLSPWIKGLTGCGKSAKFGKEKLAA